MLKRKTFDFGRSLILPERYVREGKTDGRAPFAPDFSDRADLPAPLPLDYQPRPGYYRVRLSPERKLTTTGLWLPDTWVENWTEAQIVGVGPGEWVPLIEGRATMWASTGNLVLFRKHAFKPVDLEAREGLVHDRDLLAIDRGLGMYPANDLCQIDQDAPEEVASETIVWAEEDRPRPMSGTLRQHGPGLRRTAGPYAGTRRSCKDVWGLPWAGTDNLRGRKVFWPRDCEALAVGREVLEFLLIRASDLIGWA